MLSRTARLPLVLALLAPVCVRCSAPTDADPLVRFETCDELQVFLEDRVLHPQQTSGGFGGVVVGCSNDFAVAGEGQGEGEGRSFTTTNTQEVDVDEPDFVKNNGDHIFVIRRGTLYILQAWPPESTTILASTPVAGRPFAMFFDGDDRALVLGRAESADAFRSSTTATLLDVSDKAAPRALREVSVDAAYVDARRVGDTVVLVTRSFVQHDANLIGGPFRDDENRARLRAAGVDSFVPRMTDRQLAADGSVAVDVDIDAVDCANTYAPRRTPSTDLLLTHTLSMRDAARPITASAVVGASGSVYASTKNLYLIGTEVYDGGQFTPDFGVTRIHKIGAFDEDALADPDGRVPYLGSAVLDGVVKDELSVDEDEASGTLRVVLTKNDDGNNDPTKNQTALVVLESRDAELIEVARAEDIGHGEVVESVRFIGDRAYVVTFPSADPTFAFDDAGFPRIPFTDPLFAIDLSDPRAPVLRGVLEVDGYSTYIHPVGDDHLLTIGVRVSESEGRFLGLQLSLFDVRDLDAPRLAHRYAFGDAESGSEALVERHAFTYFPELKALAIPYQHATNDVVDQTALAVFTVDVDDGFGLLGLIDQLPLYAESLQELRSDIAPCGAVRRSIMMNDSERGGVVYAISTAGVTVAPLSANLPIVRSVPFPIAGEDLCDFTGSPL
jgi:hypothetical protein